MTDERWAHIISRHPEINGARGKLLETISEPDLILKGDKGTKLAVRFYYKTSLSSKYLIVVYKEISRIDGFILTAYFSNKFAQWREELWKK